MSADAVSHSDFTFDNINTDSAKDSIIQDNLEQELITNFTNELTKGSIEKPKLKNNPKERLALRLMKRLNI